MRFPRAQHEFRNRRRTTAALAAVAGVASTVAIVAGTAQASSNLVYLNDSGAHYAHAVGITVDGKWRDCRIINDSTSHIAFGPKTSGSDVWLREYWGDKCSWPNDYHPAMKTIHLYPWQAKPGAWIDLHPYPVNGWG
jgi:hypothetical protein